MYLLYVPKRPFCPQSLASRRVSYFGTRCISWNIPTPNTATPTHASVRRLHVFFFHMFVGRLTFMHVLIGDELWMDFVDPSLPFL